MVSHSDLFCHQIDLHKLSTPAPHEAQVALEGGTESTGVDWGGSPCGLSKLTKLLQTSSEARLHSRLVLTKLVGINQTISKHVHAASRRHVAEYQDDPSIKYQRHALDSNDAVSNQGLKWFEYDLKWDTFGTSKLKLVSLGDLKGSKGCLRHFNASHHLLAIQTGNLKDPSPNLHCKLPKMIERLNRIGPAMATYGKIMRLRSSRAQPCAFTAPSVALGILGRLKRHTHTHTLDKSRRRDTLFPHSFLCYKCITVTVYSLP